MKNSSSRGNSRPHITSSRGKRSQRANALASRQTSPAQDLSTQLCSTRAHQTSLQSQSPTDLQSRYYPPTGAPYRAQSRALTSRTGWPRRELVNRWLGSRSIDGLKFAGGHPRTYQATGGPLKLLGSERSTSLQTCLWSTLLPPSSRMAPWVSSLSISRPGQPSQPSLQIQSRNPRNAASPAPRNFQEPPGAYLQGFAKLYSSEVVQQ